MGNATTTTTTTTTTTNNNHNNRVGGRGLLALGEMGGAPRNPAPGNHCGITIATTVTTTIVIITTMLLFIMAIVILVIITITILIGLFRQPDGMVKPSGCHCADAVGWKRAVAECRPLLGALPPSLSLILTCCTDVYIYIYITYIYIYTHNIYIYIYIYIYTHTYYTYV